MKINTILLAVGIILIFTLGFSLIIIGLGSLFALGEDIRNTEKNEEFYTSTRSYLESNGITITNVTSTSTVLGQTVGLDTKEDFLAKLNECDETTVCYGDIWGTGGPLLQKAWDTFYFWFQGTIFYYSRLGFI